MCDGAFDKEVECPILNCSTFKNKTDFNFALRIIKGGSMRIPKNVTIQGHRTKIKLVSELPDGKDTVGVADVLDHEILIHKDLSPEAKRRIMLHEIFHTAMWRSGVSQSIAPEIEEVLCQSFAYLFDELKRQKI